ncbi:DUF2163 domain-containing protein [Sphingomonas quercus]|uniref:DUF2163 domain-containing protein n=1 Tax=Sphingomonas quercus TaxID=2842451 RepID=A0ABS6BJI2_9SPHN|nr:DUF2163 domain-containing protein [Sphingomonas quercus]
MTAWLDETLTTLAFCWRLERRDGVTLGFTSHDRDLVMDGLVYRAAPGMAPSAITRSAGLEVSTLDVGGALTADAITEADLAAGRWDGARLRLWAVDWTAPDEAPLLLARGEIGDVGVAGTGFTAELRGPAALLERPVVEATSPECRASLGDRRCRVDLGARTAIVAVVEADGLALRIDRAEPAPNGYGYGRLRWLDGPNGGLAADVAASAGDVLTLREAPAFAVTAGERVMLEEGCDRRLETCAARFANAVNFRGEPHLPGNDLLTRYPGA